MVPGHVDGGFHIVRQDDELRGPAVIIRAETDDVDLSHSGRKIPENTGEDKRVGLRLAPARLGFVWTKNSGYSKTP
jgi:hypothetical protein